MFLALELFSPFRHGPFVIHAWVSPSRAVVAVPVGPCRNVKAKSPDTTDLQNVPVGHSTPLVQIMHKVPTSSYIIHVVQIVAHRLVMCLCR